MTEASATTSAELSAWWKRIAIATMAFGFAILILLTVKAYENAPPIPGRAVDPARGAIIFTRADVIAGQEVFLKHGLMDNGTIWGHGGYLGPDFSAQYLHDRTLDLADHYARERLGRSYADISPEDQAGVRAIVAFALKENRFNPSTDTLTLLPGAAQSFEQQAKNWTNYLRTPANNGGLQANAMTEPREIRQLTAFFAWAAWASVAKRPGKTYSYTNNFPYDPLAGNTPTTGTLIYSAVSLIFLLGGTAAVLFAFGKFDYFGWHGRNVITQAAHMAPTGAQCATVKFMGVAVLLFLAQVLIGGAVAHYRAEPGDFYGIDLSAFLPSNLLRTWHLQLAIFWVATAYVGGAMFVAGMLGRDEPAGQRTAVNFLFFAIIVVAVGSLLGEWAGLLQWLGNAWFWFGDQGWEFLEIGRFWQILLAIGLVYWVWILWRWVAPVRHDPERRELVILFIIAAAAIPVFYLAVLDCPSLGGGLFRAFRDSDRGHYLLPAWASGESHRAARHLSGPHSGFRRRYHRHRSSLVLHWPDRTEHGARVRFFGAGGRAAHFAHPRCLGFYQGDAGRRRAVPACSLRWGSRLGSSWGPASLASSSTRRSSAISRRAPI